MNTNTNIKCLCNSINYENSYTGKWKEKNKNINFKLLKCQICGLQRTDPAPKTTTCSYDDFQKRLDHRKLYQSFAQNTIKTIFEYKQGKHLKILDVGSNIGIFVEAAKEQNWEVIGIDIDRKAIEIGKKKYGVDLRNTLLENAGFQKNEFDVVTLSHTLEHVYKPLELLKEIKRVLKDNGIIIIEVPNVNGLPVKIQKLRGEAWYGYDPLHHVWQFEPKTLNSLIENSDYEILNLDTSTPLFYEKTGNALDILRDIILKISGFLGLADQIILVARPQK